MSKKARARGGKSSEPVKKDFYNAEDSEAKKESEDDKGEFKKGGRAKAKAKRKRGGLAHGGKPQQRADKPRRARGGGAHSPLTAAADVDGRPGGHYDGKPSSREDD